MPWQVEQRGLEPVPPDERHLRPRSILWTWLAANIGVLGVSLGSGLVSGLGLNLWQAVIVTVVGTMGAFAFVALVSIAGPLSGAPTLVASRATFGVRGNRAPAVVSWLVLTGLEVMMATTSTFAIANIAEILGFPSGPLLDLPVALVLIAGVTAAAYVGHSLIMWMQKWLGWVLGGLTAALCAVAVTTVDWPVVMAAPAADFAAVLGGIGVVAAGTGVSWMSAGADYTRYLDRTQSKKSLFAVTIIGAVVPVAVLVLTGTSLALGNDQATGIALPDWLLIPYLIVAVLGMLTSATLALYSSGLSLQAVGVPGSRPRVAAANGALVAVVTMVVVGARATSGDDAVLAGLTAVIGVLAVPLVAWVGVFGLDLLLRRDVFTPDLTVSGPESDYWFRRGFHVPAVASWIVGSVAGLLCVTVAVGPTVWFSGPLADTWLGRNSLGWLVAGIAASAVYWVLEPLTRSPGAPGRAHPSS